MRGEHAGLAQHRVDQRGLAVVDVGDDRDVADVGALGHEAPTLVTAVSVGRWHRPLTADELLAEARRGLVRLEPEEAAAAMSAGAVLVDIRSELQRDRDGVVPGSVFFPRNVLEWRCDPASDGVTSASATRHGG